MNLRHWQGHYGLEKKYLNYVCYDMPEIFDLHEIDSVTGRTKYLFSKFKSVLRVIVRGEPYKYVIKKHDPSRLDEHFMPIDKTQNQSLFF